VPLGPILRYKVLSYAWKETNDLVKPTAKIFIEDNSAQRWQREQEMSETWQKDPVGMMGEIYCHASEVIIWLGKGKSDDEIGEWLQGIYQRTMVYTDFRFKAWLCNKYLIYTTSF